MKSNSVLNLVFTILLTFFSSLAFADHTYQTPQGSVNIDALAALISNWHARPIEAVRMQWSNNVADAVFGQIVPVHIYQIYFKVDRSAEVRCRLVMWGFSRELRIDHCSENSANADLYYVVGYDTYVDSHGTLVQR